MWEKYQQKALFIIPRISFEQSLLRTTKQIKNWINQTFNLKAQRKGVSSESFVAAMMSDKLQIARVHTKE